MRLAICARPLSQLLRKTGRRMKDETVKIIEAILKRGNDVQIQRKGAGYVVLEVKREIKYRTPS